VRRRAVGLEGIAADLGGACRLLPGSVKSDGDVAACASRPAVEQRLAAVAAAALKEPASAFGAGIDS
jgi:hypothetical protein